jgi:tetratricopeptide (TPR) repeat protein
MSSTKTTTARGQRRGAAGGTASGGKARAGEANVNRAIAQAEHGRVNVSVDKAIQMAAQLYGQGKFDQAERVCAQILKSRPKNADAHNIRGVSLQGLGKGDEAIAEIRTAIELAPKASNLYGNLGEVLRQNRKLKESKEALEKAIELDPKNAQALNNLGIIHFEVRRYRDAISLYRRALEVNPSMAEAHNNLGNSLRVIGDIEGAIAAYQDALTHREFYPEAYNNLGTLLQQRGQMMEAEHALRKAIAQGPRYVEAYNNLALLLSAQKKDVDALRVLSDALQFAPENIQILLTTARIQMRRGNYQAAEQATRLILKENPDSADAKTVLGQLLHETDRYDEALAMLEEAVEANPQSPEALNFYGVTLKSVGRLDEARETIMKALSLNNGMWGAYANLNDLVDFSTGEGAKLFEQMDAIFKSARNPEAAPFLPLHFAYAKALDDRGEHERALQHYILGGKMKRAQLEYTESETFAFFDAIRAAFPKEAFENRKFEGIADERPVFIIGMPRSGSTLVEQILSSHPGVFGAGEVKYLSRAIGQLRDRFPSLPKYPDMMDKVTPAQLDIVAKKYLNALTADAGDAKKVTDKLLTNYFFVGLIHLLYPNAKFVNTQRDPVDTCLSGFTKLFKDDMPHSYDLSELGRYYGKYRELMEHWTKVLPEGVLKTVQYEDVVADTEKEARALIDFIGLKWDPKCVDFHKSDRPVKTASVAQVRKPIYKTSVKRWKKYGDGLQPLIDAIDGKPAKTKGKAKVEESAS